MQTGLFKDFSSEDLSSFLSEGAIVQHGSDSYKMFIGPFSPTDVLNLEEDLIFKPNFWDFLSHDGLKNRFLRAQKVIDLNRQEFIELLLSDSISKQKSVIRWQDAKFEPFKLQFEWLQLQMKQNLISKGPAITLQQGDGFSTNMKSHILATILEKKSQQNLYGFWNTEGGLIGFTPEVLIDFSHHQLTTFALAGTWSKQGDLVPDFSNLKIRNEHEIVIEDILQQLQTENKIAKSATEILELEHLFHLKTKIQYQCDDVLKFIHKLHPTAALGLFPRSRQLFSELKNFELQKTRLNFGAPFGFINKKAGFLVVAIRNIFWHQEQISIYSGCGITAGSELKSEWLELESKRNSVKKTLGLNL